MHSIYNAPANNLEQESDTLIWSRDWDALEGTMLMKIAMAEAEGEGALYFETDQIDGWVDQNCEYLFHHGNHNIFQIGGSGYAEGIKRFLVVNWLPLTTGFILTALAIRHMYPIRGGEELAVNFS